MKNGLKILNRYKFTLIYSAVFAWLGGFVLAVPFAIGGLVVDWLLSLQWEHTIYSNAKYYLSIPLILLILYQPLIFGVITPETNGGLIYSWIMWTQPFADRMAEYFPIIDNYSRQMPEKGGWWLVPVMRHYVAVCWFFNFVLLPLAAIDAIRFLILIHRHNFYIYTKPENVHKWLRKMVEQNPGFYDSGKPRRPLWVIIISAIVLLILSVPIAFFCLKQGYWGVEALGHGRHFIFETGLPIFACWLGTSIIGFFPLIYFLFGRRILVYRVKKSSETIKADNSNTKLGGHLVL